MRNPADDMPAYSDAVLSDKDIADIYAFVQIAAGSDIAEGYRHPEQLSVIAARAAFAPLTRLRQQALVSINPAHYTLAYCNG